jgi:hypothetical protein
MDIRKGKDVIRALHQTNKSKENTVQNTGTLKGINCSSELSRGGRGKLGETEQANSGPLKGHF